MFSQKLKYLSATLLPVLAACASGADDEPAQPDNPTIMLQLGSSAVDIWQAAPAARATGLAAPAVDPVTLVGVFAAASTTTTPVFDNQLFCHRDADIFDTDPAMAGLRDSWPAGNNWIYTPAKMWGGGAEYTFVACAPYTSTGVSATVGDDGALSEFLWEGLSSISATDLLLSECGSRVALSSGNTPMPLTLKHLMARLRFCFILDDDYASLRTVVLKQIKVTYPESRSMSLSVGYAKEGGVYTSTYRWQRGEPGTGATTVTLRNEVPQLTLAKDSGCQPFASLYYEPGDPLNVFDIEVDIEVDYDIYDTSGLLLRANDHAVSAITMLQTLERGHYYDIIVRIVPSYLYILSDNDPDTDGALIIP